MRLARDRLLPRAAACVLGVALAFPLSAQQNRGRVQMLVQDSPLAGFRHAEAAGALPDMRVGDELRLVREPDNAFDSNAVRVEWRGRKLGYVPRRDNAALAWALDRGETLRARVSRCEWNPNPARRIAFQVFVE